MIHIIVHGLQTNEEARAVLKWVANHVLKAFNDPHPSDFFLEAPQALSYDIPRRIHMTIFCTRNLQDVIRDDLVPKLRETRPEGWTSEGAWVLEGFILIPVAVYIPNHPRRR